MKTLLEEEFEIEDSIPKDIKDNHPNLNAVHVIDRRYGKRVEAVYQLRDILKYIWPLTYGVMPNSKR